MTSRQPLLALSFAIAALCSACTQGPEPASSVPTIRAVPEDGSPSGGSSVTDAAASDAVWRRGDLDGAFAAASAEDKPVLLYWGAEWCPYCADLEAHVFSREDVSRKLSLFVPVYLDGDDTGAQRWAETFGVAGYPTVLALDAERTELARIAGGMPLEAYAEMLDLVLGDVRPLDDVLAAVGAGALSADECRRLAFNGWGLEDSSAERAAQLADALEQAAGACPTVMQVERARLTVAAAFFWTRASSESPDAPAGLRRVVRDVRAIVAAPALAVTIADALRELDGAYFDAAKRIEPEHTAELLDGWTQAMDAAFRDPRYGQGDRLAALRSKIEAISALTVDGVPAGLTAEARRAIDATLADVGDSPARRGAVNSAINLLVALGDIDRAYALAEHELAGSRTPFYHMADLAWLDEIRGRHESALEWLERAYRTSTGPATRFQWGTSWVRGLLRMAPENEAAIRDAALEVLGELDGPDRIYRRSRARLETLDTRLREWATESSRDETLDALRARMSSICEGIPETESAALESCKAFLAPDLRSGA